MTSYQSDRDPTYTGTDNLEVMKDAKNYNNFIEKLIVDAAPSKSRMNVFDFGAGSGQFSGIWSKPKYFDVEFAAIELDEKLQRLLAKRNVRVTDLDKIQKTSADFIYSINVLEHIENDIDCLIELHSKLKDGGKVFIYVPAFKCLWTDMDDLVGHVRRYKKGELREKLSLAQFHIESIQYHDCAGFFAALAVRYLASGKVQLSRNKIVIFDRIIFPLSRFFDAMGVGYLFGKNISVTAVKH
jgi:SAM-dependent methyltransferase